MRREKEVPEELLNFLKNRDEQKEYEKLNIFCTHPVKVVKMKVLNNHFKQKAGKMEGFRMVIIPAIDIYVSNRPYLKDGYLKREALSFFVSGTRVPLPYGHIYSESGYVCLGNIFVPSAVPKKAVTMPIETLFLHNDRNLSHGNSCLYIDKAKYEAVNRILFKNNIDIRKDTLSSYVIPGRNIIKNDEIWNLSADVLEQKSLPNALKIMTEIYAVIFPVGMKIADCTMEANSKAEEDEFDDFDEEE